MQEAEELLVSHFFGRHFGNGPGSLVPLVTGSRCMPLDGVEVYLQRLGYDLSPAAIVKAFRNGVRVR